MNALDKMMVNNLCDLQLSLTTNQIFFVTFTDKKNNIMVSKMNLMFLYG